MENPIENPQPVKKRSAFASPGVIVIGLLLILCCSAVFLLAAGGAALYQISRQVTVQGPEVAPLQEGLPPHATPNPAPTPEVTRPAIETVQTSTLDTLKAISLPARNMQALACRLQGLCGAPLTAPSGPFSLGDQQIFNGFNVDDGRNFKVDATLQDVTDHAYFWVQDGVEFNSRDLRNLAEGFEDGIYPTTREFFGSEWSPGIDGDPHIHILFARDLGASIAGFFSSADESPPQVHRFSNAHEMFFFNADHMRLRSSFTYGVLAHEFQHMIHWNQDVNESTWLNEGFSELAALLNGYDLGGFDYAFISDTDIQLNEWEQEDSHYGAGFLFTAYFLDRFGQAATQAIVRDPANGLDSFDSVLRQLNLTDPLTSQPITADDFFLDWAITNYVHDGSVADGRYQYHNYADAPEAFDTETFSECPTPGAQGRDVHQYGTDYIRITCPGSYTLHFEGSTELPLLAADPYSGKYAFWSNKGDESATALQREFDFTQAAGPIEMTYHTWYEIESGYDYLYLEASTDGEHWQLLNTPSGTARDPFGNSYGWGYTGSSKGWIEETVDLSQFAGQKVQLRFEYITDDGSTDGGMLLDDISVPAADYFTDFESGDGGWQAAGFARIQNSLPQTFRLALISKGDQTTVQIIPLSADQTADIPITIGSNGVEEAILLVSGTTRFTTQLATYRFEIK
jgi:hypothetical protein